MTERQRQVRINIAAFLLLFFVSLYRQVSLRYLPDDPFRTYSPKSMRTFLMFETAAIMMAI